MKSDESTEIIGVLQDIASSLQIIATELEFMNGNFDLDEEE
jgi:hypothetical protein